MAQLDIKIFGDPILRMRALEVRQFDDTLRDLTEAYEQATGSVHPTGDDEGWWHRANGLWLASREYMRRNTGCEEASRKLKEQGPDRLG